VTKHPADTYCSCCGEGAQSTLKMTWRCDACQAEWDFFTYGGPCPNEGGNCGGTLHWRKKSIERLIGES
jgi:hypothetical protein